MTFDIIKATSRGRAFKAFDGKSDVSAGRINSVVGRLTAICSAYKQQWNGQKRIDMRRFWPNRQQAHSYIPVQAIDIEELIHKRYPCICLTISQ